MPWYKTLATYADKATVDQKNRLEDECNSNGSKFQNNDEIKDNIHFLKDDPDSKLLSLVIEKVVIVRVTNFVRSAYDPLSTSQTLKLTSLLERFISLYPTVNGQSRQVRELLEVVKEKLRTTILLYQEDWRFQRKQGDMQVMAVLSVHVQASKHTY